MGCRRPTRPAGVRLRASGRARAALGCGPASDVHCPALPSCSFSPPHRPPSPCPPIKVRPPPRRGSAPLDRRPYSTLVSWDLVAPAALEDPDEERGAACGPDAVRHRSGSCEGSSALWTLPLGSARRRGHRALRPKWPREGVPWLTMTCQFFDFSCASRGSRYAEIDWWCSVSTWVSAAPRLDLVGADDPHCDGTTTLFGAHWNDALTITPSRALEPGTDEYCAVRAGWGQVASGFSDGADALRHADAATWVWPPT